MVGHLFIVAAILAPVLTAAGANADPHPEPMLVPPVNPACVSSPFGPSAVTNHPQAGTCLRPGVMVRRASAEEWKAESLTVSNVCALTSMHRHVLMAAWLST